ncbi:MAG: UMP kinase [Magnetospiraceae bacterium]
MSVNNHYNRILVKLSGEGLMGERAFGLDDATVSRVANEVKHVHDMGVQVCLVIGGGNIFRGVSDMARGIERASADYMGMLATVMNAIGVQSALEAVGVDTRVQSAIPMPTVCESFIRRRAIRHLEKRRVVIFAAGTGNPFFTTDTAAALRAVEMSCDVLMKATQVDGVYDSDPRTNPSAQRFDRLNYDAVLARNLKVMDAAAIALARENQIPILVFSLHEADALARAVRGEGRSTLITGEK